MVDVQSIIAGKYVLLERLSAGGGGVVWKTRDATASPDVQSQEMALKILTWPTQREGEDAQSYGARKEQFKERFKREFELFKKVSHPNIVKIYDFGFDEEHDVYFFTSELLLGGDLRKMAKAPIPVIEQLLLQSLRALEYLRNLGILHLDVKPQNLLLRNATEAPTLALIDFGLATFRSPEKPAGTPNYMPPEVVMRRFEMATPELPAPDHRSDLYSLGVTFYYLLTKFHPFEAYKDGKLDKDATMLAHLSESRPPPPSVHNRSVPPYLDAIIMRLMARHSDERYQAAILVAQALCFRSPNHLEVESKETINAYLPEEGLLIGRHEEKKTIEEAVSQSVAGKANPIICIAGGWGMGKTRLLKSIKPFAQQQEIDVFADLRYDTLNFKRPMAFLIDDPFLSASEASSISNVFALKRLIQYISRLPKARCFVAFTLNTDLAKIEAAAKQLEIDPALLKVVALKNFTPEEVLEYLTHLLGEAPPQDIVAELNSITFGNPKFIADVVKRVIEKGELFSYFSGRAGAKTLTALGFSFVHAKSPSSLSEHLLGLVEQLPQGAKYLAHRLACWQRPADVDELLKGDGQGDLATLLSSGLVRRTNEGVFSFTNPLSSKIIEANLDPKERASIHDAIAAVIASEAKQSPEDRVFELNLHRALGSDPKLQGEAALKLATEAPKRLHPAEAAEFLRDVEASIAKPATPSPAMGEGDLKVRSELLIAIGQSLMKLGRWDEAKATFDQLHTLVPLRADEQIGLLALKQRKLSEARDIFTKALNALTPSPLMGEGGGEGDPSFAVQRLRLENYLAGVDLREGKYDSALEIYKRTADSAAQLSDTYRVQIMNNELGETLVLMGKPKEAVEVLERELEWAKRTDHREHVVNRLRILGDAYRRVDNFPMALERYNEALKQSCEYHFFDYQLRIRNGFANMLLQMGKFSEAVEQYKPALELAMQLEGKATSVDIMTNIGFAYTELRQFNDAIEYLVLALDFAKGPEAESSAQVISAIPRIHVTLGHAYYEKNELNKSKRHLMAALELNQKYPLDNSMLYSLHSTLIEISLAEKKPSEAEQRLSTLEGLSKEIPNAAAHFSDLAQKVKAAVSRRQ